MAQQQQPITEKYTWACNYQDLVTVKANSKSEARAKFKKVLGLKKLPVKIMIFKV